MTKKEEPEEDDDADNEEIEGEKKVFVARTGTWCDNSSTAPVSVEAELFDMFPVSMAASFTHVDCDWLIHVAGIKQRKRQRVEVPDSDFKPELAEVAAPVCYTEQNQIVDEQKREAEKVIDRVSWSFLAAQFYVEINNKVNSLTG